MQASTVLTRKLHELQKQEQLSIVIDILGKILSEEEALEALGQLHAHEAVVPLSIFSANLSPLETVVKYLKENKRMKTSHIARLLQRTPSTISISYKHATVKHKKELKIKGEHFVPFSSFSDSDYTVFECIVKYLHEDQGLRFSEIGVMLHRDQKTIWTVYHRACHKEKKNKR
jgi:hypothetical protein